jgi:tRNA dimethylallyltransferase
MLHEIDPSRFAYMNPSDRHNPRRLVRAIEIATFKSTNNVIKPQTKPFDDIWIGLSASKKVLEDRIKKRVGKRLADGVIEETQSLLCAYPSCESLLRVTLGYEQVLEFLSGNLSEDELREKWSAKELQYAKRQLTWFSKNDQIHWFSVEDPGIDTAITNLLQSWHQRNKKQLKDV